MWLKIGWTLAFLVLLGTGLAGMYNLIAEAPDVATPLQVATTVGIGFYGVFGIAAAVGLALRRRWALPATIVWTVAVAVTAVLAPIAYAPQYSVVGVVVGGAISLLLGAGVYALARRVVRDRPLR